MMAQPEFLKLAAMPLIIKMNAAHGQFSLASPMLSLKYLKYGYPNDLRAKISLMSPTIFRDGSFRFFFFSREESRMHVHVSHPDGEAKFWLRPELALATSAGLSSKQINEAEKLVQNHLEEIANAWHNHFPS